MESSNTLMTAQIHFIVSLSGADHVYLRSFQGFRCGHPFAYFWLVSYQVLADYFKTTRKANLV